MSVTNGYCTLDQLKAESAIVDTTDDLRLEMCIGAASRQIDGFTGRRFWQDSAVKVREFYADNSRICYVDDISTATGLIVKVDSADNGFVSGDTTLTITSGFVLRPLNAADDVPVRPYTEIVLTSNAAAWFPVCADRPGVQVTAKFGWPAVPDDVTKACLIQANQLFKAQDAVFGGVTLGEMGALRVRERMNPIAAALLEPYVKQL
jgi:hypothetical protein